MKYVFIGKETGSVLITTTLKEERVLFAIEDAAVGIREQDDPDKSKGSGLMLVNMVFEQLNGVFTIDRKQETRCILEFDAWRRNSDCGIPVFFLYLNPEMHS